MNNSNYSDIFLGDIETLSVNYVDILATKPPGVTIASATWDITRYAGTADPNPSAMLIAGATGSIDGSVVSISVQALVSGAKYWPRCTAILSDGEKITLPDFGRGSLAVVG